MGGEIFRTLPVAALQQDSLILDEQDKHLVLTLRVPKEWISKNHLLLMDLVELSIGRDTFIPAAPLPDPPARKRKSPYWIYGVVLSALFVLPSPIFTESLAALPPPVEIETARPAKPAFKIGEAVDIVFHYRRDRSCRTTYDHLIERSTGETPSFNMRVYGSSSPPTLGEAKDFHLLLKPPVPLTPGNYVYTGYTHSTCAKGGDYDEKHPDVTFTVVE